MLILAMELSTRRCSLALLDGPTGIAEAAWEEGPASHVRFFRELRTLFQKGAVAAAAIDGVAVGLGPGSFSGLRMALTAAQALTLPRRRRVAGISSSKALALEVFDNGNYSSVTVVGDARRGRLWLASYPRNGSWIETPDPFVLTPPERLADHIPEGSAVVSPDWPRIGAVLTGLLSNRAVYVRGEAYPKAGAVARLLAAGWTSESSAMASELAPLTPIYLQPPVEKAAARAG